MASTPDLIVFDVNETLSDMSPLGDALVQAGVAEGQARTWFAGILRDGFAMAAAGGNASFAGIAPDSLHRLLIEHGITAPGSGSTSPSCSASRTLRRGNRPGPPTTTPPPVAARTRRTCC